MLFYKVARVEWHPRGVLGAIVPWNYPFHNVLNPVSAALFSGNAILVKARPPRDRRATAAYPPRGRRMTAAYPPRDRGRATAA